MFVVARRAWGDQLDLTLMDPALLVPNGRALYIPNLNFEKSSSDRIVDDQYPRE